MSYLLQLQLGALVFHINQHAVEVCNQKRSGLFHNRLVLVDGPSLGAGTVMLWNPGNRAGPIQRDRGEVAETPRSDGSLNAVKLGLQDVDQSFVDIEWR